uniref:HMG box domain-containing protein n=1 Tax=Wuchereria bancrofti TaxID=6293 RepID=A0A1I8ET35_WUCBA
MDISRGITEWQDIVSPLHNSMNRNSNKRKVSGPVVSKEAKVQKKIVKEVVIIIALKKYYASTSDASDDIESAQSSSVDLHFSPSQIAKIVQELRTKVQQKKKTLSKKFLGFNDFDDIDMPPGGTKEMLKTDLRRCLKEASLLSTMTVPTALELLHAFLEEGHSVTMDPAFPKKPPNAFSIFMRKAGHSRFSSDVSTFWNNESNAAEKAEAKKEALQLMEKYLSNLHAYRETHQELTLAHRNYVDNAISTAQKAIDKSKGMKTNNSNRKSVKKKEPKTAFDLFAISMANKYVDLEPEKREKRLRKKFDKLSEAEREIYDNLAAAL